MELLTPALRIDLRINATLARDGTHDPVPLVKFFNPLGAAMWLGTELYADGDTLFGLADLGFGCPELGVFSLGEIASVRLPFGLIIERDLAFATTRPLSVWAETARALGSLRAAEALLGRRAVPPLPLPPPDPGGG